MIRPAFPTFAPRAPWLGPDLQTLRNKLRGPVAVEPEDARVEALVLPLADGSGDRLAARHLQPSDRVARADAPLVVLVHGLGGSHESDYLRATSAHLLASGWPVLQLDLRGAGASRDLCRQQYHAGRSEDFRDALRALPEALTGNGIVAVGFSLGGNMLLKYAAEYGGLRAVGSVSAPIDLAQASHRFLDARNRGYHLYLLAGMKREALAAEGLDDAERTAIESVRTILEFDERVVAPRNGFASAADYYAKNHARQFLGAIDLPALLVHACNDPWIPSATYTTYPWERNPKLTALLPKSGGHVGFHDRARRACPGTTAASPRSSSASSGGDA